MLGSTLIANTVTPWSVDPTYVGIPSYQDNAAVTRPCGTTAIPEQILAGIMPLKRLTFQLLR